MLFAAAATLYYIHDLLLRQRFSDAATMPPLSLTAFSLILTLSRHFRIDFADITLSLRCHCRFRHATDADAASLL